MKIIRNILLIALALLVHSTLVGRFDIFGVRPDLAMLVFLFIAYTSNSVECILYGFLIGFLQDVYTPEYLGFNSLTMSLVGFAVGFLKERVTIERGRVHLFVTFFTCLMHDGLYLMMYTHFDFSNMGNLFLRVSVPAAVYTSVLSVLFITVWDWIEQGGVFVVVRQLMGFRQ